MHELVKNVKYKEEMNKTHTFFITFSHWVIVIFELHGDVKVIILRNLGVKLLVGQGT